MTVRLTHSSQGAAAAEPRDRSPCGMEGPAPPVSVPASPRLPPEGRGRKCASPNIFQDVDVRRLRRLFRRAGDQDAEQRAELVWGHGDAAELTQALIALRARRRLSRAGAPGQRGARKPKWLRAFGHLRISEVSPSSPSEDTEEDSGAEPDASEEPGGHAEEPTESKVERLSDTAAPVRHTRSREGRDPDHYLHRILH